MHKRRFKSRYTLYVAAAMKYTPKHLQASLALVSLLILLSSLYLQYVTGLMPCPLCLMQRSCVFFLVLFCTINYYQSKTTSLLLQWIIACLGLLFATRQIWLQIMPTTSNDMCLPGLDVMFHYLPWSDIVWQLVWGTAECSEVQDTFFWLTLADWSAVYFLLMTLISGWLFFRRSVKL